MALFSCQAEFDGWFETSVGQPTAIQNAAWPVLRQGDHALLLAPTGHGKSLAAWRPLAERLCSQSSRPRGVRALHVAPLKALARDMTHNLAPLLEFAGRLRACPIEIALRCGDTTAIERARQRRKPPEILATTPESLFVLLGSAGGRALLKTVEAVVVDELQVLATGKRGAHLSLSLARLDQLCKRPLQRIGLSATAHPVAMLAEFLGGRQCRVIEPEPARAPIVELELPEAPLGAYANTLHWQQTHQRVAELASTNSALLVFCQTRAQVERSAGALGDLLGDHNVGAHHGSLDGAHRESVERRFKEGRLEVLVSSASLELGLDLGYVDRVCQLGVPGSLNLVRQRAGRSGHRPGQRSRLHLFPLTLNQLIEAEALGDALGQGQLDALCMPDPPLDVLSQQLIAMVAAGIEDPEHLLAICRGAHPWRNLARAELDAVVDSLTELPQALPETQRTAWIVRRADQTLKPGVNAASISLRNAGVIPEWFEYEVVQADTGEQVGRLDEEFAFESSMGQVLQLGHRSWRILRVMTGRVLVEPAQEDAAHLPFWFGEGPGRSNEVARAMLRHIHSGVRNDQARCMLNHSRQVLAALPDEKTLVIERFPDPGGDLHVVVHSFAGARINRAWGLALRKRFCRQFNFELQAVATDDGILISLGVTSDFELEKMAAFVTSKNVENVLIQALLDTPMFVTRFRWCANNALQVLRFDTQGQVAAQRQRSQTENLIACVFPDQLACLENLSGPRQVPDHPLVRQALDDCLHQHMDIKGLKKLLQDIENKKIRVHAVELDEPSPLAAALIHAPRHSFLDDAAAEERRTRSFEPGLKTHRSARPGSSITIGSRKACPAPQSIGIGVRHGHANPESLLELLLDAGFITATEGEAGSGLRAPVPAGGWSRSLASLTRDRRALAGQVGTNGPRLWIASDRIAWIRLLAPSIVLTPWISEALIPPVQLSADEVLVRLVAGRRRFGGERAAMAIAGLLPVAEQRVRLALEWLGSADSLLQL
ncbi:MAG: DEAD/DEAH box helicase [Wenzhouxiangellaceae bacterium]|nr:DEAD/DEAH box helicase [Wenzhouxiangellaceae bacterium]